MIVETRQTAKAISGQLAMKQTIVQRIMDYWLRRTDYQDRDDLAQELTVSLLEAKPNSPKLAFTICRNRVTKWWRHNNYVRNHEVQSLNQTVTDEDGNEVEAIELVAGEVEFEAKIEGKINANSIFSNLPPLMKRIVAKRLLGIKLKEWERVRAYKFLQTQKAKQILELSS